MIWCGKNLLDPTDLRILAAHLLPDIKGDKFLRTRLALLANGKLKQTREWYSELRRAVDSLAYLEYHVEGSDWGELREFAERVGQITASL